MACCSSPTGIPPTKKNPPMQSISTAFVLVDIPTDWDPQANQQPTGLLVALPLMRQSRLVRAPLLRRQLLYPPELRAHVVIPWVPLWRQLCIGTRCEKYNTIQAPFCQAKNAKIFFLFSKPAKHCFTAATCPQSPKQSQARLRPRHRGYGARRSAHGQHR